MMGCCLACSNDEKDFSASWENLTREKMTVDRSKVVFFMLHLCARV